MLYRTLADALLVLHFAFVLFAVFGGFLALRWKRVPYAHLPALAWGVFIELSGTICPLTPLENDLRAQAGQAGYDGGFIEHYIMSAMYPDGLTQHVQYVLAGLLVAINLAAYGLFWRKRKKASPMADTDPSESDPE